MNFVKFSRLKKVILGILLVVIITSTIMLIDSLRSTQTLENRAASPIPGQCLSADRFCEWETDKELNNLIFHYQIVDVTNNDNLIAAEGDTNDNFVSFSPLSNRSYKCMVNVKNNCNVSSKNYESAITQCKADGDSTQTSPTNPPSSTTITPSPSKLLKSSTSKGGVINIVQTKSTLTPIATISAKIVPTASSEPKLFVSPTISKEPTKTPIITQTTTPTRFISPPVLESEQLPKAGIAEFLPMIVIFGFGMIVVGFLL